MRHNTCHYLWCVVAAYHIPGSNTAQHLSLFDVFLYFIDRAMAEIGYTRLTYGRYRVPLEHTVPHRLRTTSHWSKPHRIRTQPHVHRVYPIMAEEVVDMYPTRIQATRLWPDHSTTNPHAYTHAQRARTPATSRSGALVVISSRSSFFPGPRFLEFFFADLEVAVRPFHMQSDTASRKRLFSAGLDFSGPSSYRQSSRFHFFYRQSGRFYSFCALPRGGWCEGVLL